MNNPSPNSRKQPISEPSGTPRNFPGHLATMPDPESQGMIKSRAYELYERRGRENGYDEEDWLRAEQEILKAGRR